MKINQFLKRIFAVFLVLIISLTVFTLESEGTIKKKNFLITGSGGQENPSWAKWIDRVTYLQVYTNRNYSEEGTIVTYHTFCLGSGYSNCRVEMVIEPSDPEDPPNPLYDDGFVSDQLDLMWEYSCQEIFNNAVYSGSEDFNTFWGGISVYQHVDWEADSTNDYNLEISIIPDLDE